MAKLQYISKAGLQKLQTELEHLKNIRRREVAARIEAAKELGDLSENAEYTEAKEEQAFLEGRILELENIVQNAQVISESPKRDMVGVGSKIKVSGNGKEKVFEIVGSNEADPSLGKISNESPLGQAFLGKRVGETVEVEVPAGKLFYKILEVF